MHETTDSKLGEATALVGDQRRLRLLSAANLPRYALVPGDPDRVDVIAGQWDEAEIIPLPRGYRAAVGNYRGIRLMACSSGVGGASFEGSFTDMVKLGVDTFVRVGTTGTLRADIAVNSLIINDASVRMDGTTALYVRPEYPAVASHEVTFALVDAASKTDADYRVGTGATTGSFTVGQGRPGLKDFISPEGQRVFEEMTRAGVLNFEMEASVLFTLSRIYGLRAGAVLSVIANRVTGTWGDGGGVELACRVGADALVQLARWDQARERRGSSALTAAVVAEGDEKVEQ
jgi:uridine phosphorylase